MGGRFHELNDVVLDAMDPFLRKLFRSFLSANRPVMVFRSLLNDGE